jgi:hypothetical protein
MAVTQNIIVHRRSAVIGKTPTAAQLMFGEFGINFADGRVFIKKADSTVLDITEPLYSIDGGLLVGTTTALPALLAENGSVVYTENYKRVILG